MSNKMKKEAICLICGKSYTGEPALSRKDNATLICPDCGIIGPALTAAPFLQSGVAVICG